MVPRTGSELNCQSVISGNELNDKSLNLHWIDGALKSTSQLFANEHKEKERAIVAYR